MTPNNHNKIINNGLLVVIALSLCVFSVSVSFCLITNRYDAAAIMTGIMVFVVVFGVWVYRMKE
jgi:hypothetical protein